MDEETGSKRPKKKARRTPKKQSKAKASRAGSKPKNADEEAPVEKAVNRSARPARQARPASSGGAKKEPPDPEVNLERSFPKVIDALLERGRNGSHLAAKAAVELIGKVEERKQKGGRAGGKAVTDIITRLGLDAAKPAVDGEASGAGESTEGRTRSAI